MGDDCAAPWEPPKELTKRLRGLADHKEGNGWNFRRGKGCRRCSNSGYFSRIAVYEQFLISDTIKALVAEGEKLHQVRQAAQQEGLQTLLQSALNKVREGITTLDEAFSVCGTHIDLAD